MSTILKRSFDLGKFLILKGNEPCLFQNFKKSKHHELCLFKKLTRLKRSKLFLFHKNGKMEDQSQANSAYSRTWKDRIKSKLCLFKKLERSKPSELCFFHTFKRSKWSELCLFQEEERKKYWIIPTQNSSEAWQDRRETMKAGLGVADASAEKTHPSAALVLCSVDMSRWCSGPCVDKPEFSKGICCPDTSRSSSTRLCGAGMPRRTLGPL